MWGFDAVGWMHCLAAVTLLYQDQSFHKSHFRCVHGEITKLMYDANSGRRS
jgi:hypothetical protein